MGHSQAEKAETHQRIVNLAAKRFREYGLEGISIADLMEEADLAVGGFYKHFASRDDLVVEALAAASFEMDESPLTKQPTLKKTVGAYLSKNHRDNLEDSCPVAALVGDVSRNSDRARRVYTDRVERRFAGIAEQLPDEGRRQRRAKAILICSACVGAIGLSRAVSDADLSDQILKTVAKQLSDIFSKNDDIGI